MKFAKLMKYVRIPLEVNGQPGYQVAIITDTDTDPSIGEALAAAAYQLDMEPHLVTVLARTFHTKEPSPLVAEILKSADMSVCPLAVSINHTSSARAAVAAGRKVLVMPGATVEMLTSGSATEDPRELQRLSGLLAQALSGARRVVVTCEKGTNVTFSLEGRNALPLDGLARPGRSAGFPTGEAATAPLEGTTEGSIVFDASMHSLGLLKEPVRLEVREGYAVSIEGGAQARQLREMLDSRGDANSRQIGEFAVGTNSKARVTGNVTEDKKKLGTVHFALGDNGTLGGKIESRTHLDGIISRPTVVADGRLLVKDGKVVV